MIFISFQFPNFSISNRIPGASIASVHGHIKSIHLFRTHYSGQKVPIKSTLIVIWTYHYFTEINILNFAKSKMWHLRRKISTGGKCWNKQYNFEFQLSKSITCKVCDLFQIKLSTQSTSIEEKSKLQTEKYLHENIHCYLEKA